MIRRRKEKKGRGEKKEEGGSDGRRGKNLRGFVCGHLRKDGELRGQEVSTV